ncbi:MAG: DMT family protein [Bdellovibrionaceae bacterium]|nr:DMT family protein [Pseudobdellovibrionaceae bacterium]
MTAYWSIFLLCFANIFMTFAWYGHLKNNQTSPLWIVILASWGIAFFEYCLQVPANRLGLQSFTLPQLKIIQEVITLAVFLIFSYFYMNQPLKWNYLWASMCILGAVFFIFREG